MIGPHSQRTRRGEQGSAVVEFVTLGVVLLIPLVYLILMLGRLQAGAFAVSSIARESSRAFVSADTQAAAESRGRSAARIAADNLGFGDGYAVQVQCERDPCLSAGSAVHSSAQVRVPIPLVPAFARRVIPLEVTLRADNVTRVDRFRVVQ